MFTKEFWKATGNRAIRSVAQGALMMLGTNEVFLHSVDWLMIASGALGIGVLSVLTSIAFTPAEVKLQKQFDLYQPKH